MKELTEHGTPDFPIFISRRFSFPYNIGVFSWHWHNDFELTYIADGRFEYSVGSDTFVVNPGETILINSKVLHQVNPLQSENSIYYSYVFAPEFLCESSQNLIYQKYILPLVQNQNFPYYVFQQKEEWEQEFQLEIEKLNQAADSHDFTRELCIQNCLQKIFLLLIKNVPNVCCKSADSTDSERYSLMKIMLFIKEHYWESVTLQDMADIANISKSSCNRLFRKTLKMTPFEYLLDFRINQSLQLLGGSNQSITSVASACGFHDVSYFCKVFREKKGISPQRFRQDTKAKEQSI